MFLPNQWRQARRRGISGLIVALMAVAVSVLLCCIHGAVQRSQQTLDQIYGDIPVTCTVTNLTGTQTDQLELPEWVVSLFFSETTSFQGTPLSRAFSSYVTDVQAKMTMDARLVLEDEEGEQSLGSGTSLVAITARTADKRLRAESGCTIYWRDGYDEGVFASDDFALLVPQSWLSAQQGEENWDSLTLSVSGDFFDAVEQTFQIAGTYTGGGDTLYCSWTVGSAFPARGDGFALADSVSATIANNRELEDFWADCASVFFVTPDPEGKAVPWENSIYGTYYPYALDINDGVLTQTVADLTRNQTLLNLLADVVLGLSLTGGFLIALLLIQGRQRELALAQVLGVSRSRLFVSSLAEQLLLALLGTLLGALGYWLVGRASPAWGQLALAVLVDAAGIAIAVAVVQRKDLIRTLGGEH